jgi:hypothetical protein
METPLTGTWNRYRDGRRATLATRLGRHVTFRITDLDRRRWEDAACRDRLTLAAWIRKQCQIGTIVLEDDPVQVRADAESAARLSRARAMRATRGHLAGASMTKA